jgi:hypothetical protein
LETIVSQNLPPTAQLLVCIAGLLLVDQIGLQNRRGVTQATIQENELKKQLNHENNNEKEAVVAPRLPCCN